MTARIARATLPARVYVYAGAVTALALLLLPVAARISGWSSGYLAAGEALLLAGLIVLAHRHPVEIGPKRKLNVGTAPEVAAVLLLPGLLAVAVLAIGTLAGEAPRQVRPVQRLFNAAVAVVRATVGVAVLAVVQPLRPAVLADLAAPLAAAAAMYLSTFLLIRGIVAVQLKASPISRASLPPREVVLMESALSLTGIMAALAAQAQAWALLLLLAPALIAERAVRTSAALRAQTQVAEDALVEANAALATRDQFLSIASHELRTPLTALKGNLQLLARWLIRDRAPPQMFDLVAQSEAQTDRLARLVKALLDVSQIRDGRFVLTPEPVSLGPFLRRLVTMHQASTLPPRRIELSLSEQNLLVEADVNRLEQAIVNLLDNACKYSSPHTPVQVRLEATEHSVSVAVRDEGIGIAPVEQARIFERFHRSSEVDKGIAGLGLGLYIADQLVRAHGGRLSCESEPGRGSTFTITLPRHRPMPDDVASAERAVG